MRLLVNLILIVSLLFLPWWVGALFVLVACFFIKSLYEVVLYGILFDGLYGSQFGFHGFVFLATFYTSVVFFVTSFLRTKLVW